jgi:hypothetical protein
LLKEAKEITALGSPLPTEALARERSIPIEANSAISDFFEMFMFVA